MFIPSGLGRVSHTRFGQHDPGPSTLVPQELTSFIETLLGRAIDSLTMPMIPTLGETAADVDYSSLLILPGFVQHEQQFGLLELVGGVVKKHIGMLGLLHYARKIMIIPDVMPGGATKAQDLVSSALHPPSYLETNARGVTSDGNDHCCGSVAALSRMGANILFSRRMVCL